MKVLDHGYVEFIESWGSDERIIESARMSTGKGFKGWADDQKCEYCGISRAAFKAEGVVWHCPKFPENIKSEPTVHKFPNGDEKFLRFLWENKHLTPFEMGGMTIEVQAPIFVFREWLRHRTQSYNEMSGRYTPLPDVHYLPTADRCLVVQGNNKQANAANNAKLTHEGALLWLEDLSALYENSERVYQRGLTIGVPKELARLATTVSRYSRMRASTDLRNWLAFLTLRMAPNAQWEIQQFANAVGELIKEKFPRTWDIYVG